MAKETEPLQIKNFTIVGLGLIGGSVAKDIKTFFPKAKISAIDPDDNQLQLAIKEGNVNQSITYKDLINLPGLVIIATPINLVIPSAIKISESLVKGTDNDKWIVIDIASVKSKITRKFEKLTNNNVEFIGTHPMAGTEFTRYKHARKHLFRAKPWMITPHAKNSDDSLNQVKIFINKLGGRIRVIDPVEHDKTVALVSHAVIMLSNYLFDFVATSYPEALEFAGDGFTSTTRLASGNPQLHSGILASNRDQTRDVLSEFNTYLANKIASDINDSESFFIENMISRNHWLHKRK